MHFTNSRTLHYNGTRYITASVMAKRGVHPGKILLEEFLEPMGLSQNGLARLIGVPPRRINEIVLGKRGISADTAIRLARRFKNSERYWMQLQMDFDLEEARKALTL